MSLQKYIKSKEKLTETIFIAGTNVNLTVAVRKSNWQWNSWFLQIEESPRIGE